MSLHAHVQDTAVPILVQITAYTIKNGCGHAMNNRKSLETLSSHVYASEAVVSAY